MTSRTHHWPNTGRHTQKVAIFLAAITALIATGLNPAHAGEARPLTVYTHLQGQEVEQLVIHPDDSLGTVVIENGSRADMEGWSRVISALATQSGKPGTSQAWSVFAYNRPGIGRSASTERPRNGHQIVDDLRDLLKQQRLKPPYLLVGHSLGGLYMQLFARLYPNEVQGLILVDSLYPGIIKRPEEFPLYAHWGKSLFFSRTVAREIDAIYATGEEVMALPWASQIPVTRLVNVPKSAGAIAIDLGVVNTDDATIARVRALYPGAKTVEVDSDHQMQKESPEVIVQAIQELMRRK